MMNLAEIWRLRPTNSNPCRHIKKYPEEKRERFLSETELTSLGTALDAAEKSGDVQPSAISAIRLLILTGARLSEILSLLEAQRDAIERFAQVEGIDVIDWYTEIESGKGSNALSKRPERTGSGMRLISWAQKTKTRSPGGSSNGSKSALKTGLANSSNSLMMSIFLLKNPLKIGRSTL